MPTFTRKQKRPRTKNPRRKKPMSQLARLYRLPLGAPPKMFARLRYAESVTLNPAAGLYAHHVFATNDIYDPSVTGVGHQPSYYDQYMTIYDKWIVVGSRISVKFQPTTNGNLIPGRLAIIKSGNVDPLAVYTSVDSMLESNMMSRFKDVGNLYSVNSKAPDARHSFDVKKDFKIRDYQDNAELIGEISTSPTDKWYYDVAVMSISGNDPAAITLMVVIDYIVQFFEPQPIDTS